VDESHQAVKKDKENRQRKQKDLDYFQKKLTLRHFNKRFENLYSV